MENIKNRIDDVNEIDNKISIKYGERCFDDVALKLGFCI